MFVRAVDLDSDSEPEPLVSELMIRPEVAPQEQCADRCLSEKIIAAFHHACDLGDYEIARRLLSTLELLVTRHIPEAGAEPSRGLESLVAAHGVLWHLRHADPGRRR
jgi:hypothetical protein